MVKTKYEPQRYIGVTEAAYKLDISRQRLRVLLAEGKIVGAFKMGPRAWAIPLPIVRVTH